MKYRLASFVTAVVLLDVIALGAVWHVGPTLALTAALAVPEVDAFVLARVLPRPVSQPITVGPAPMGGRGVLYRTEQPRSAVVLVRGDLDAVDPILWRLAATLARQDVAVLVPDRSVESAIADGSAGRVAAELGQLLGVPARVERAIALQPAAVASPLERVAEGFRLLRLARSLLAPH